MAAAQVREACHIPGTSVRTAWLCRDKPSMKQVLREAGVPDRRLRRGRNADQVREFAAQVGYPLILKPRSGAGAAGTTRVDSDSDLGPGAGRLRRRRRHLDRGRGVRRGPRGVLRHLVDRRPAGLRVRLALLPERAGGDADPVDLPAVRLHQPGRLRRRLRPAQGAWGAGSTRRWASAPPPPTWSGSSGRRGCASPRSAAGPSGVGAWDLYAVGNEIDIYREWANAVVHGQHRLPAESAATPPG